jgi:hypothetical protein
LTACNASFDNDDRAIARAYNEYLYASDIESLVPKGTLPSDSLSMTQNYVNTWLKNQLLLHKAERNLNEDQKDFSRQLEDYKNSLIIYKYETELIKQNLDTLVDDSEIEDYYFENAGNFRLNQHIVRLVYARVNDKADYLKKIKKLVWSKKEEDRDSLEYYCMRYAEDYDVIDREWITFDEMQRKVPVPVINPVTFLSQQSNIEFYDEPDWYFAQILDYGLIDSISPLSLEKENIRSVILNKRKKLLIKKMQDEVYEQAVKENGFEYY